MIETDGEINCFYVLSDDKFGVDLQHVYMNKTFKKISLDLAAKSGVSHQNN